MPPNGLYPVPRQHLYGGSPHVRRRTFNSMDFQAEEAHVGNSVGDEDAKERRRREKRERRREKEGGSEDAKALADTATSRKKSKKKSGEKDGEGEEGKTDDAKEPVDSAKGKKKRKSKDAEGKESTEKKRKRDSEVTNAPGQGASTPPRENWLQGLDFSVGDIGAFFDGETEPKKKSEEDKKTSKGKSTASTTAGESNEAAVPPAKKKSKSTASTAADVPVEQREPVPPAKKKSKKDKSLPSITGISIARDALTTTSVPRHTPVPLPLQSTLRPPPSISALRNPSPSDVLVIETPPSQLRRDSTTPRAAPIPFSLSKTSQTTTTPSSRFRSTTLTDDIDSSQDALTSSNLLRYTAPLNDKPKPRPAASVSSASSMSIKDALARMGKPQTAPAQHPPNPIFTPAPPAPHPPSLFPTLFTALLTSTNPPLEHTFLAQHTAQRTASASSGPLPCLRSATGCNAKSEAQLTSSSSVSARLKLNGVSAADHAALHTALRAGLAAETFLTHAVTCGVPVPLGTLEGVYTLYCAKYSSTHVDRYNYGQRLLSISRPSGFKSSSNTYIARLAIPPSPVACSVLAFAAPPHASFRVTRLTTSSEGYAMGLVCLGNGYVLLRADMGLLLTGKASGEMEFVGVRERDGRGGGAVVWPEVRCEGVEEGGGGGMGEKVGGDGVSENVEAGKAVDEKAGGDGGKPVKVRKKVGRKTNAERQRIAEEKAKAEAEAAGREA